MDTSGGEAQKNDMGLDILRSSIQDTVPMVPVNTLESSEDRKKKENIIVRVKKLPEQVNKRFKGIKSGALIMLERATIETDQLGNNLDRTIDSVQRERYRGMLNEATRKLNEDRAAQEKRMIEGGFLNRFRGRKDKNAKRRIEADLKQSSREIRRLRKEALITGDNLNKTIVEYNNRTDKTHTPKLVVVEPGEPLEVREGKLNQILEVAQSLRGYDDITATALINYVNDFRLQRSAYNNAISKRDNANTPRLYLGTQNAINQRGRIVQAEEEISIRDNRLAGYAARESEFNDRRAELANRLNGGLGFDPEYTQSSQPSLEDIVSTADRTVPIKPTVIPELETLQRAPQEVKPTTLEDIRLSNTIEVPQTSESIPSQPQRQRIVELLRAGLTNEEIIEAIRYNLTPEELKRLADIQQLLANDTNGTSGA